MQTSQDSISLGGSGLALLPPQVSSLPQRIVPAPVAVESPRTIAGLRRQFLAEQRWENAAWALVSLGAAVSLALCFA